MLPAYLVLRDALCWFALFEKMEKVQMDLQGKTFLFHGDEYRAVLQRLYPRKNWKKVRFCTNYTIDSPCVMGIFTI